MNQGLILKINLSNNTYTILDNQDGKLTCKLDYKNKFKLFPGLFINYQQTAKQGYTLLSQIETELAPTAMTVEKIKFLHHLLELLDFFIPEGMPYPEIADFIKEIYAAPREIDQFKQKILICRLFYHFAIVPEKYQTDRLFDIIINYPVDMISQEEINLESEKYVNNWIIQGINSHPAAYKLKTVRFLNYF